MPPLVPVADKIASVRDLLTKMVPQLALAVGSDVSAKRLARIATTSVLRTPRLLECDPKTLAGAVMEAAQLGLEPDGHEAHLVPFRNNKRNVYEVQLIPDYKGLAKLARNSSRVKTLDWRAVHKGDKFEYRYGSTAVLVHIPSADPIHKLVPEDPKKPDGKKVWIEREITHAYALAMLDGGEAVFEVMPVEDIEWHRDRYSRAAGDGPWVTNFDDMSAKTCFRKLAKKLPRSSQDDRLGRAVALDEKTEQGIPQELGTDLIGGTDGDGADPTTDVEAPPKNGKLDKLADALKKNGKGTAAPAEPGAAPGVSPGTPERSGGLSAPAAVTHPETPPATAAEAPPRTTAPAPAQVKADRAEAAVAGPGGVTPSAATAATARTPTSTPGGPSPAPAAVPSSVPPADTAPGATGARPQAESVPASQPAKAGGTSPSAATAAVVSTSSGAVPGPAAEPHPLDAPRAKVVGRIHDAFKTLELDGDSQKHKRDFLYGRFLGPGVLPTEAPIAKMETLATELERLGANKKKK